MQNSLLRSLFKNSLFQTAYLCKTSYAKQLIRNNLFMQNSLLGSLFLKPLIRNNLFMQNNSLSINRLFLSLITENTLELENRLLEYRVVKK